MTNLTSDFLLGGTRYKRSIGGIFSYDCQANITTGILISGSNVPSWTGEIPSLFCQMLHPITVVVAMAEALMETVLMMKASYRDRVKRIEGMSLDAIEAKTMFQDHRPLAIELGLINWHNAKLDIGFERSRLHFGFALKHLEATNGAFSHQACKSRLAKASATLLGRTRFSIAALETLGLEHNSNQSRLETQKLIVSNLIAQQDLNVSLKLSQDSNEIAAASRRDSSIMRIIAILGMVFLPATFTVVSHHPSWAVVPPTDCSTSELLRNTAP